MRTLGYQCAYGPIDFFCVAGAEKVSGALKIAGNITIAINSAGISTLSVDKYAPGKLYCIIESSWVVSTVYPEKYVPVQYTVVVKCYCSMTQFRALVTC